MVVRASGDDGGRGSLSLSGSGRGSGSDGSGREGNRAVGAGEWIVLGARVGPGVGATRTFLSDIPSKHNNEHSIRIRVLTVSYTRLSESRIQHVYSVTSIRYTVIDIELINKSISLLSEDSFCQVLSYRAIPLTIPFNSLVESTAIRATMTEKSL